MNQQTIRNMRRGQKQPFNEVCGFLLLCAVFMIVAVLLVLLIQIGVAIAAAGLRGETGNIKSILIAQIEGLQENGLGYLVYCGICLIAIGVWKGKGFYRNAFHSYRPMSVGVFLQLLCVFFAAQAAGSLISGYLESVLQLWGLSTYEMILEQVSGGGNHSASMFLYTAILAPVVEELLFRGAILRSFQPYGKRFAIFFSALLFGLFHMNLIQTPFAFMIGLILGYVAVEYSLTWCVLLHFLNNCVMAELLSDYVNLQNALVVLFAIAALIILSVHGNDIKAYHRSLNPMPKEAIRSFWTAPVTIIFLAISLISCLMVITAV